MIKQAPRLGQILGMCLFVMSCFGVLMYLWFAFGGSGPLQPKGYRFHVLFPEATQLAQQADVRIAGVPVGKVVSFEQGPNNTTDTTIELDAEYAPVPRDARAMLRQKTLLGETFVDLTPGHPERGRLRDGGTLPHSAVEPTVELDEIFRSFDPETKRAFQTWMQSQSEAADGRAADINAAFGNLPEFVSASEDIVRELNAQAGAFRGTIASTGHVFDALSERHGQLRALITESNRTFEVTARRNRDLAAIWRELPRFARESRLTLPRLTRFSKAAEPSVRQLQPVASSMEPAFDAFGRLAPEFKAFFRRLGPVITASKPGVPAFERTMRELPPLLKDFEPFLRNFNPMIRYLDLHRRELTAFLANATATTSARDLNLEVNGRAVTQPVHYIRAATPLAPESLTYYPRPLGYSRANAYAAPGVGSRLAGGLPVGDTRGCANGDVDAPETADPPELQPLVELFVFRTPDSRAVARPGCVGQGAHPGFGTSFPRLLAEP